MFIKTVVPHTTYIGVPQSYMVGLGHSSFNVLSKRSKWLLGNEQSEYSGKDEANVGQGLFQIAIPLFEYVWNKKFCFLDRELNNPKLIVYRLYDALSK